MKKIITAIDNPEINKKLSEELKNEFKIIGKDIQYREAILEIIKEIKDVNLIILYEKILGFINMEELLTKIEKINPNIEIIFFLEKEDEEKRKLLNNKNIKNIYLKNELNYKNLIKIINQEKIENNLINKFENKIITIIGKNEYEKNILILFFIKYLEKINKKILIINFNKINKELFFIFNKKNIFYKIKNKKIIFNEIKNKEKFVKNIKKLELKFNKNITYIFKLNFLLKKICKENKEIKEDFVNVLLEIYENKFDYIIINDSYIYNKEIRKEIIKKSKKVVWNYEKEYLGPKDLKEIIEIYNEYEMNFKEGLHITIKSKEINSISESILKEICKNFSNISFINFRKELKKFSISKNKKNFNSKNTKRKIKKIIE